MNKKGGMKREMFKFDLDPTPTKALIIAILLFAQGFLMPIEILLASGVKPTEVQLYHSLIAGILAMVIYLLGFLGYEGQKKKKTEEKEE